MYHRTMATTATLEDILNLVITDYTTHERTSITSLPGKVKALREAFPDLALEEFCYDVIDEAAKVWTAEDVRTATVNRRLAMLKRAFKLGRRHGLLSFPLPEFPHYTEHNTRTGYLDEDTASQMWQLLPRGLSDFCRFLYACGMRKGQAAKLTWDMVIGDELHIPAKLCKAREPMILPLRGELQRVIDSCRTYRQESIPFIFHFEAKPIGDFRKKWREAAWAVGKSKLLVHDLRRSAVRNLRLRGVPHEVCKRITGHKTDSVFWRYRIVTDDEVKKALEY